jgi:hypothetical protein
MKANRLVIVIECPVAVVFDFTIDPNNTPLWIDSVVREETNERNVRIGTRYRNVDMAGVWTAYEVVAFRKDALFELKALDSTYSVRYCYESVSGGRTRLTYYEWVDHGEIKSPFDMRPLEKLKRVLERR